MDRDRVLHLVYEAIDVINQQLPAAKRLRKSPDTVIAGTGGVLDSLGIVTFVLTLEDKVGEATGASVQLLERDVLVEDSPLQTVRALTDYIVACQP
jgi:hypothetical protein